MILNFIRWADKIFSSIIVRFLFLIWLAFGPRRIETPLSLGVIKKVLIIKFFGSGSILLASPTIYKIKECLEREVQSLRNSLESKTELLSELKFSRFQEYS